MLETAPTEDIDISQLLGMDPGELEGMELSPEIQQQLEEIRQQAADEAKKQADARQARVQALGMTLKAEFDARVTLRQELERRWLKDIRRYNGMYDPEVLTALQNRKYGSTMFVPLTRRLCNIVEARLGDLLYPTDDRNFAIKCSPVPELAEAELLAGRLSPNATLPLGENGAPVPASAIQMGVRELREEATKAADAMQREVEDQLKECNYPLVGRQVIHDGILIGTGVMKGPMVLNRTKKSWKVLDGVGKLTMVEDLSPVAVCVSPWDFFPDPSARNLKESASEFEVHAMTKVDVARLAKQPGFDKEAVRQVLSVEPGHVQDYNRQALREASGMIGAQDKRYRILEYHGPIDPEDLRACGCDLPDDPLMIYEGVVWMSDNGIILKAIINPMDTEERPYSVWCWQKDPGSIFGFGLSSEVADLQDTGNGAFRAALDNLGLSVGPQIVISKDISPVNSVMAIEPNKLWEATKSGVDIRQAFAFFQIDSKINDLLAVFNGVKALMDEIAGTQLAMQGQDAPSYMQTATGASIAYNASNIWMRRAVRNWDDDITSPTVGRFVDWNMQYNPKKEIKGDLNVISRGTTALLESEGQAQRVALFMQQLADMPMPYKRKVAQARQMATSLRIDPVDILPSDDEVEKLAEKYDNAAQPANPELERIKLRQAEIADKAEERAFQMKVETIRAQLRTAEIASRENISTAEAQAKYGIEMEKFAGLMEDKKEQRAHDAQKFNAEMAAKTTLGSGI